MAAERLAHSDRKDMGWYGIRLPDPIPTPRQMVWDTTVPYVVPVAI